MNKWDVKKSDGYSEIIEADYCVVNSECLCFFYKENQPVSYGINTSFRFANDLLVRAINKGRWIDVKLLEEDENKE